MDKLARVNTILYKTWGWDGVARWLNYFLKLLVWRYRNNKEKAAKYASVAGKLSEYRIITRYMGVPNTVECIVSKLNSAESRNELYYVELLQNFALLGYYPLENIAWLMDHKILFQGDSGKLWRLSSQFWAIWILLELYVLYKRKQNREKVGLNVANQGLDLILAYHWSVAKSPFSDLTIAITGLLSSTISLLFKWKATQR